MLGIALTRVLQRCEPRMPERYAVLEAYWFAFEITLALSEMLEGLSMCRQHYVDDISRTDILPAATTH